MMEPLLNLYYITNLLQQGVLFYSLNYHAYADFGLGSCSWVYGASPSLVSTVALLALEDIEDAEKIL